MNMQILPEDIFNTLSNALQSNEPIKNLMTKTLNLMAETEFENLIGAKRSERTSTRTGYRCGYRTRRFDTTCGTLTLKIPHPKKGGFIPSFLKRYQRYEEGLKKTVTDAYVMGVSTGKMNALVNAMGVEGISRSQVSRITREINDTAEAFRHRSLKDSKFPVLIIDAIVEKIRIKGHATYQSIIIVTGLNIHNERDILAIEVYDDESQESYLKLFKSLKQRGLEDPQLIVSDGAAGLTTAMKKVLPETSWQHCKVHLVRKILKSVRKEDRQKIGQDLKKMWHTSRKSTARKRAKRIIMKYEDKYPKAMQSLRLGLEGTLTYCDFREYSPRKISTSNVVERLNREFRRRSKQIGVFTNTASYLRLFTLYAMHYAEGWRSCSKHN